MKDTTTEADDAMVSSAARHWDERFGSQASTTERASNYALANEFFQRHYVNRFFGPPDHDWLEWVRSRICSDGPVDRALVLGCGIGDGVVDLHQRGIARAVHGVDISSAAIEQGRGLARDAGVASSVTFECCDFNDMQGTEGKYDAVFTVQSLHHSLDIPKTLEIARRALTPNGFFIANEYIGPNRWQFTNAQLLLIKALLTLLPKRLRRRADGSVKGRVGRPTIEWMLATDPSEAAYSESIPQAIESAFELRERVDYGCGITVPVLDEIISNFEETDPVSMRWLNRIIATERKAMKTGLVPANCALFLAVDTTDANGEGRKPTPK